MNNTLKNIKKSFIKKEQMMSVGGFIQRAVLNELEEELQMMIYELSSEFANMGISKQELIAGTFPVAKDMIKEYVEGEDGPLYSYLENYIKESFHFLVNKTEGFLAEEISNVQEEALKLLPPLERWTIKLKRENKKTLANAFSYLNEKEIQKLLLVSERNLAINENLLERVFE